MAGATLDMRKMLSHFFWEVVKFDLGETSFDCILLERDFRPRSFFGIGSLGITPYINASIVIQLLTPIIPSLERLQKEEGELGRKQIKRYTRYLALG